jgi:CMP-N,N'-diacetyllegionaminic acid synthase
MELISKVKSNSEVWAIIPARSGSKGVPDKNIMELAGYPLIAYSIAAARNCSNIDRVFVTTDSKAYAEIALKYGAEVPFFRPSEISGDSSTDLEFFQHALDWFRKNLLCYPKYFVHLRPTSPIRESAVINEAILSFINGNYSALRSAHKMSDSSYKTFEVEDGKLKMLFNGGFDIESTILPRQLFPMTFNPNGYVDIIRTSMIDKDLLHGNNVQAFITDVTHEIDEKIDFDYMKFIIKRNQEIVKQLFND